MLSQPGIVAARGVIERYIARSALVLVGPSSPPAKPSMSASISARQVSLDYSDRRPFKFNGTITGVIVELR